MFLPNPEALDETKRAEERRKKAFRNIEIWGLEMIPPAIRDKAVISASEVQCGDPDCSPIDTNVCIMFQRWVEYNNPWLSVDWAKRTRLEFIGVAIPCISSFRGTVLSSFACCSDFKFSVLAASAIFFRNQWSVVLTLCRFSFSSLRCRRINKKLLLFHSNLSPELHCMALNYVAAAWTAILAFRRMPTKSQKKN